MITEGGTKPAQRINRAYELLLARSPRPAEQRILLQALAKFQATYQKDPKAADEFLSYGDSPRRPGIDVTELAAYSSIASMIFNLDAAINKE
jgi:hypothetical protein